MIVSLYIFSGVLLAVACLIFLHLTQKTISIYLAVLLCFLTELSFWVCTDLSELHSLYDSKGQSHNSLLHWHKPMHYCTGEKYYKELHHDGLYDAFVLWIKSQAGQL